jgi:hypothetical protein
MSFSVSEAKSLFSSVFELYKKGANLEAEQKLQELQEAFIDLKSENLELREELLELREKLKNKENLIYEAPFYYLEENETKDGPFCQKCYDDQKKLVRLIEVDQYAGSHYCKVCENHFGDKKPFNPGPINI